MNIILTSYYHHEAIVNNKRLFVAHGSDVVDVFSIIVPAGQLNVVGILITAVLAGLMSHQHTDMILLEHSITIRC